MGTTWEEVEVLAQQYIKNEPSLEWDMANRLPVFYNRMAMYMRMAIPRFNRPPEMLPFLSKYTAPDFENIEIRLEESVYEEGTIDTSLIGFDIYSVGLIEHDKYGDPQYSPIRITNADSETGVLTVSRYIAEGSIVDVTAYRSGSFDHDLDDTQKGILAFCIYDSWEHRFDNDVLERTSKIRDSAFSPISEASQTAAGTQRQREVDKQMFDMLRAYQDNVEYLNARRGWRY